MWIVARFSPFEWEIATSTKVKRISRRVREYYVDDCYCSHDNGINELSRSQCCEEDVAAAEENCNQRLANEYFNNYRSSYVRDFQSSESYEDDDLSDELIERAEPAAALEDVYHDDCCGSNEHLNQLSGIIDECTNESEIELTTFHNDFTLINSFWYTIGTLMAGSDLHPKVFMHIKLKPQPPPNPLNFWYFIA